MPVMKERPLPIDWLFCIMEIWKDVDGYEGIYQVSNFGNVRSLDRMVKHPKGGLMNKKGKLLNAPNDSKGYKMVFLSKDGRIKLTYIHHLVAKHFLGYVKTGRNIVVDHIDSCKTNNHVNNLQVITQRENVIKGKAINGESKYAGVSMCSRKKRWIAQTRVNGVKIIIGRFDNEEDARDAYLNFYS